jgi:hypothetical protein
MPGGRAIEREAGAIVPDLDWALTPFHPANRGRRGGVLCGSRSPNRRQERVLRKQMEDVGEDEFLMLLLAVATKLNQGGCFGR